MPSFCRHNRLVQNCAICSRERELEVRPLVSSSTSGTETPRARRAPAQSTRAGGARAAGVRVSRLSRGVDDGYHSPLAPGLRSSEDAERLVQELAFAATRLERLVHDPPGVYAEVGAPDKDLEERTWLAFLIAYLCPLDAEDPFAEVKRVRSTWSSGEFPKLDDLETGPRSAHDPAAAGRTIGAYRAWAARAGSQASAFTGESTWTPERRFARVFERLALPGLHRDARFDLLVTLGQLGVYDLRPATLALGGADPVTLGAKRALGIGDSLLLERRAAELADACRMPLASLDLGLYNWERGERAALGLGAGTEPDPGAVASARTALGL